MRALLLEAAHSVHDVDSPLITPDRTHRADPAACVCGSSLAEGVQRTCTGDAASHHSERVEHRANQLLHRLQAVVLMGTLDGELKPLSA